MRTSRVSATTSSTFRNEQQYLHAGDISHDLNRNQQFKQSLSQKKKQKKSESKKQQAPQNKKRTDMHFDEGNDLQIRNDLHDKMEKLNRINKQKKRLKSYRSSI